MGGVGNVGVLDVVVLARVEDVGDGWLGVWVEMLMGGVGGVGFCGCVSWGCGEMGDGRVGV